MPDLAVERFDILLGKYKNEKTNNNGWSYVIGARRRGRQKELWSSWGRDH